MMRWSVIGMFLVMLAVVSCEGDTNNFDLPTTIENLEADESGEIKIDIDVNYCPVEGDEDLTLEFPLA